MSENRETSEGAIVLHPHYQTAHAQVTEPARFVAVSHYYRRRWLRQVGPVGTAILLELRGRCYNNPATGERRDTVAAAQRELAEAIGISVDTLQRQLGRPGQDADPRANQALRRFVWAEERYERGGAGRVRQLENVYHVAMDDPVHPDDEERLEALVAEYERQARDAAERARQGRKQILPAGERDHREGGADRESATGKEGGAGPGPQIAALRPETPARPRPGPQNAAGGHRKMRQGSPQNAALSEESLLLFTRDITESTLNVGGGIDFVSGGDGPRTAEDNALRAAAMASEPGWTGLDRQVAAVVEELRDWGSERRHRQLLSVCDRHDLSDLPRQALQATRQRLARETKRGVLEKPGAYYQRILITLLEGHQVFVPKADEDDADEVRRLARISMGMDPY